MTNFNVFAQKPDGTSIIDPIIVTGSAVSNSSSQWSLDISSIGLAHVYSVSAQAKSADATAANLINASISTFSTSTVSGGVAKFQNINLLGGSPITGAGANVTVYVTVVGSLS